MPLEATPTLPPAIPHYDPDIEHAWMMLGQKEAHINQLQSVMLRRAKEANDLHDAVEALAGRQKALLDELEQHRQLLAESDSKLASTLVKHMNEKSLLESSLESSRLEAATYMDEVSRLRALLAKHGILEEKEAA